jgi:Ca2+/Na+ antiporter
MSNANLHYDQEDTMILIGKKSEVHENKNIINNTSDYSFIWIIEKIRDIFICIYSIIIPDIKKYSEICFIIFLIFTFLHTKLILSLIEALSKITYFTPSFLGMTLLSLGGNVGDTINASIAAKLNAGDLMVTSILGSQIMNLQICLGVPWLISILKNYYYKKASFIDFGERNPMKYFLPSFLVVLLSIFIMTIFGVRLNKKSGICLIILYILYLMYELETNIK